ncbi:hypothetical protein [Streptomyces sp. BV286]|uniref:hypothetical protein n=1 Tax=Streptomyces sp. BV286 TaxID=2849672 RepID=UPI0020C6C7C1|nr:hypothetical protein [Streptomyces sp. BV286]
MIGLATGIALGLAFELVTGLTNGLAYGRAFGLAFGLTAALVTGLAVGAPVSRRYAMFLLCSRHHLPFRLGLLLDWAVVTAGLLRYNQVAAFDQQFGQQLAILSAADAHEK